MKRFDVFFNLQYVEGTVVCPRIKYYCRTRIPIFPCSLSFFIITTIVTMVETSLTRVCFYHAKGFIYLLILQPSICLTGSSRSTKKVPLVLLIPIASRAIMRFASLLQIQVKVREKKEESFFFLSFFSEFKKQENMLTQMIRDCSHQIPMKRRASSLDRYHQSLI